MQLHRRAGLSLVMGRSLFQALSLLLFALSAVLLLFDVDLFLTCSFALALCGTWLTCRLAEAREGQLWRRRALLFLPLRWLPR